MGLRQERLADVIRDLIAGCFLGERLSDPRLKAVTITHVRLTPDLQLATVYFRVYDDELIETANSGLESSKGYLRNVLAKNLTLRRIPTLRFFYDKSVENGTRIEKLLQQVSSPKQ